MKNTQYYREISSRISYHEFLAKCARLVATDWQHDSKIPDWNARHPKDRLRSLQRVSAEAQHESQINAEIALGLRLLLIEQTKDQLSG